MNARNTFIALALAKLALTALVALGLNGCTYSSSTSTAEQAVTEAVVHQTVSAYHQASLSYSGTYVGDISLECESAGSVEVWEFPTGGGACIAIDSQSCSFHSDGRDITVATEAEICGSTQLLLSEAPAGFETLMAENHVELSGHVVVDSRNVDRDCEFDLVLTALHDYSPTHASYDLQVDGTVCGRQISTVVSVDLSVTVY